MSDLSDSAAIGGTLSKVAADADRRKPVLDRGKRRVEAILEATAALILEDDIANVTTRRIAERANVPIGSVYQFFTDRDSIFNALVRRHLVEYTAVLMELLRSADQTGWQSLVQPIFDAAVDYYRDHPVFRSLWFDRRNSQRTQVLNAAETATLAKNLARLLEGVVGMPAERLEVIMASAIEISDALIRYAFVENPAGDPALLDEGRRAVFAYLTTAIGEPGRV